MFTLSQKKPISTFSINVSHLLVKRKLHCGAMFIGYRRFQSPVEHFRRASVLVICLRTYWNWSSAFPSVIILYRLLCLIKGESQNRTFTKEGSKTESAVSPFWCELQNKPNLAVKLIFSICHLFEQLQNIVTSPRFWLCEKMQRIHHKTDLFNPFF